MDQLKRLVWRCGARTFFCGPRTLIAGILNVTPDSFSDGGRYFDARKAVEHAIEMVNAGADLIERYRLKKLSLCILCLIRSVWDTPCLEIIA